MDKSNKLDARMIEDILVRMERMEKKLDCLLARMEGVEVPEETSAEPVSGGFSHKESMFRFIRAAAARMKRLGKERTGETYLAALRSFSRFRNGKDVPIGGIDSDMIRRYEVYLAGRRVCKNTISFYMRILRAVYNRAVEDGLAEQRFPFRHVYTSVDKTVKRAIPLEGIRRIKELDFRSRPALAWARDMFLFSFYTRGMSFVDMAYLRKGNLDGGLLSYTRRKTGQRLTIKWEKCMQDIVDRYACVNSVYLLPILVGPEGNERRQYQNALHLVNRRLKTVSRLAGLGMCLSMYVARHSWASIARYKNVPLSVISEGMGHDSEATTQIYLMSLDNSLIDRANRIILNDLDH